jgi:alanine racemase
VIRALATVDLDAVRSNVRVLRSHLGPGVRLIAVVKADGYGHGALPVARAALAAGAAMLAVTTVEEAAALRAGGIGAPLLIMGPVADDQLADAVALGAEFTAWSARFLRTLGRTAAEGGRTVPVHLKVDSGMRRLGVAPGELPTLLDVASLEPGVELVAAMTHFATADDDPEFMAVQRAVFAEAIAPVRRAHPQMWFHAANSAATLRDPATHFDAVRCGIALYGLSPFQGDPAACGLRPALSLSSYVAAIQDVAGGEGVSYSLTWRAPRRTRVALVPIGYGDGFFRALSNRGDVLIRGRRYPRVGTVCMDQFLVDIGPEPRADGAEPRVTVPDPVVLIGRDGDERITAEELAKLIDTINYEITCSLTSRVRRTYVGDDVGKGTADDG